ncbi:MAG: 30S ribosomal protein S16, partial [Balneolales bacterium]
MVRLRLQRHGRKRFPYYHIIATDIRTKRDGRIIEDLGRFSPTKDPSLVRLETDRVVYWLKNGAQPSDTVRNILKEEGIYYRLHLERWGKSEDEIDQTLSRWKEEREKNRGTAMTKARRMKDQLKAEEEKFKVDQIAKAKQEAEKAEAEKAKQAIDEEQATEAAEDANKKTTETAESEEKSKVKTAESDEETTIEQSDKKVKEVTSEKEEAEEKTAESSVSETGKEAETGEAEPKSKVKTAESDEETTIEQS